MTIVTSSRGAAPRSLGTKLATLAGAAALTVATLGAAEAQQPRPAAPAPVPAPGAVPAPAQPNPGVSQAIQTPWAKICNKDPQAQNKEICLIAQEMRAESGMFLVSVAIREMAGDNNKAFIIAVPPGLLLQPGIKVGIDPKVDPKTNVPNPQQAIKYDICFPNACYGALPINATFINQLKAGKTLVVQAFNQVNQPITFTLALGDFGKAYDGAPIDPKVVEEQQKQLQEELQKRAEETRKKLLEQQQTPGATPPTPAPAAPTPAPKQ